MKSVVIGTAGHIDHGKSSLVRALTGTDPDRLKEEKARGITIDLGFAHWTSGDVHVAFVDVPGHERFVRNMLAGAGGIDAVLLVVAADESIMPQTREHFEICRLLGVTRGVIGAHESGPRRRRDGAAGAPGGRRAAEGHSSRVRGDDPGVVAHRAGARRAAQRASSPSRARPSPRAVEAPARLPIDRAFTMKGFGTVVTGTLVSGRIRQDDELLLLPGDARSSCAACRCTVNAGRRRSPASGPP